MFQSKVQRGRREWMWSKRPHISSNSRRHSRDPRIQAHHFHFHWNLKYNSMWNHQKVVLGCWVFCFTRTIVWTSIHLTSNNSNKNSLSILPLAAHLDDNHESPLKQCDSESLRQALAVVWRRYSCACGSRCTNRGPSPTGSTALSKIS